MTATRMLVLVLLGVLIFVALLVMELTTRSLESDDEPDRVVAAQGVPSTITTTSTTTVAPVATTQPVARTAPNVRAASVSRPVAVGEVADIIRAGFARFGPAVAEEAVRVAQCESNLDPRATNGQHASLFQISRTYHEARARRLGFTWEQMWDPTVNTTVAADIYGEQKWQPWTCRWAAA